MKIEDIEKLTVDNTMAIRELSVSISKVSPNASKSLLVNVGIGVVAIFTLTVSLFVFSMANMSEDIQYNKHQISYLKGRIK